MARIRGFDTSPELTLRRALWNQGLRYRVKLRTVGGVPDVAFPAARVAVFIDGCFWHGCPLHYARPRSNESFWSAKLVTNIERDCRQSRALEAASWWVLRLWEHEVLLELALAVERVRRSIRVGGDDWAAQLRVRCVSDLGAGMERRELVRLGDPHLSFEHLDGPRLTAKARAPRTQRVP